MIPEAVMAWLFDIKVVNSNTFFYEGRANFS
jgi:hypothetical protein